MEQLCNVTRAASNVATCVSVSFTSIYTVEKSEKLRDLMVRL